MTQAVRATRPAHDERVNQSIGSVPRIDRLQRRVPSIGFPVAVSSGCRGPRGLARVLIAYYGFFSLYPLLVVFVTLATWVLDDRPRALQRVLEALCRSSRSSPTSSAPG